MFIGAKHPLIFKQTGRPAPRAAIFAGFFTVGQRPTAIQQRIVERACAERGDLIFLVGDNDLPQMLHAYLRRGLDGIRQIYFRMNRELPVASSGYARDLLSSFFEQDDVLAVIDEKVYQHAMSLLALYGSDELQLWSTFDWNGKHPATIFLKKRFTALVHEKVLPALVEKRLERYGLRPSACRVLYQHDLLKNVEALDRQPLRRRFSSTTARSEAFARGGVMLALMYRLADEGYTSFIHHCYGRFGSLFEEAEQAYRNLSREAPEDPRWSLSVQRRPLTAEVIYYTA